MLAVHHPVLILLLDVSLTQTPKRKACIDDTCLIFTPTPVTDVYTYPCYREEYATWKGSYENASSEAWWIGMRILDSSGFLKGEASVEDYLKSNIMRIDILAFIFCNLFAA